MEASGINRRRLFIGGGVGAGLVVAWATWPRRYSSTLPAEPDAQAFGAWLKIGRDGRIMVAVPQTEHGQGIYTTIPQIVADELGADWRTVGVEPAPVSTAYANPAAMESLFEGMLAGWVTPTTPMLTAGSSSIRMFEEPARAAAATARALLCMAAAQRWDVAWSDCHAEAGFIVNGDQRLRFGDLAEDAATQIPPDHPPIGLGGAGKLMGRSVPRLDAPAKVDGSAMFAGDVRLADMVHVAVVSGPAGKTRLLSVDRAAAGRIRGVLQIIEHADWVAVAATTGWAAQQALNAINPRFETSGTLADDASIAVTLDEALDGPGKRIVSVGDVGAVFRGATVLTADYRADAGLHAAIETRSATARYHDGRLELWAPTLAPGLAAAAVARAAGIGTDTVVLYPVMAGGSFGINLENDAIEQAAIIAMKLRRPVSLVWPRSEDARADRYRPPARAKMAARLGAGGAILGWQTRIAAPATGAELASRIMPGWRTHAAQMGTAGDAYAVAGALPPYAIPALAIDHHPAAIGVPTGHLRGGAHGYTAFFTECFLDELAHASGSEPLSYRIGMLAGNVRLARCLSTAAALGGWDGGADGSGQGIAAHAFRGSYIAVMAEAHSGDGGSIVVDRLVAAVDCGRQINPDVVVQQTEGGLIFGMASALGSATGFARGMPTVRGFSGMKLPRLADSPDITVEMIRSDEAPGGVSELAVPVVAPAIANAIRTSAAVRLRTLPLRTLA